MTCCLLSPLSHALPCVTDRDVVALDMSLANLSGSLPSGLSALQGLQVAATAFRSTHA